MVKSNYELFRDDFKEKWKRHSKQIERQKIKNLKFRIIYQKNGNCRFVRKRF